MRSMSALEFLPELCLHARMAHVVLGKARSWYLPLKLACKTNLLQKKFVRGSKAPENTGLHLISNKSFSA